MISLRFRVFSLGFAWFRAFSPGFAQARFVSLSFGWYRAISHDFVRFSPTSSIFTDFVGFDECRFPPMSFFDVAPFCRFRLFSRGFARFRLVCLASPDVAGFRAVACVVVRCRSISLGFIWSRPVLLGFAQFRWGSTGFCSCENWFRLVLLGSDEFRLDSISSVHQVTSGFALIRKLFAQLRFVLMVKISPSFDIF